MIRNAYDYVRILVYDCVALYQAMVQFFEDLGKASRDEQIQRTNR